MRSLAWKRIGLGAAVAVIVATVFYFQRASSDNPVESSINPAFGEYISSYSAGILASGSTVRIILAGDVVDSTEVGAASVDLFSFKPSVGGSTAWLDTRTVEFRPQSRLRSGQVYEVEFELSRLYGDLPNDLKTFTYSFQVIPQNFELSVSNIKPYVKTDLKRQLVEGILQTADFADAAAVERALTAQQDGRDLKVTWSHTSEGRQHGFTLEEVGRKETVSKVKLIVSGESLGTDQRVEQEVEVPALGDFKVTIVRVEQGSSQSVVVQFSDPLNEGQNLEGLVTLTELPDLDFEIKDNEIRIYPPVRQTGSRTLRIEPGIRNVLNYRMAGGTEQEVTFEQLNPAVRFTGDGNVLPSSDGLVLPFEAVNLKAVDVQVVRIYEQNVLQFLQVNDYAGGEELRRVGKPIVRKMLSLENSGVTDLGKWNRYTLDLATLISPEQGAIYQVVISFKRSYASFTCEGAGQGEMPTVVFEEEPWDEDVEGSYWDSYEEYYYDEDYDWRQRDNPCHSSYYSSQRNIRKNIIASDLGLMAMRGGDGQTIVIVNDIKTTEPMAGVQLELYDYQRQQIGSASTGADGKAVIASRQAPFALIARSGSQRGYLRLADGESLSLSNFDVGGEEVKRGLKGHLYGERGVWRPGDSLFLTFVLEDKLRLIPAAHPVVFELQNPQGQVINRVVRSNAENGFYRFATATSADAPTGNWLGRVKLGGTEFSQTIKIETVKPNRLRINLDFGVDKITSGSNNVSGNLKVNWLHGAPGKNLKAEFEVILTRAQTKFAKFREFIFDDPTREYYGEPQQIFEGYLDGEGKATVSATLEATDAPGMLTAVFRGKAFEESGNFSIDRFSIPYYPYESFTGIRLPAGDKARGMLLTDTTHRVDIVTVDANGNGVSREGIELTLYKVDWKWWWDAGGDGSVNFMTGKYSEPLATGRIRTVNGTGAWHFKVKYPEWGRFFVRAFDPVSGHSTGATVYIDWPGWAGRARNEAEGATMLSFSSDKPTYNIGEQANLVIPGSENGRALISVENGSRVISTFWLQTQKGDKKCSLKLEPEMAPNIFVHVTLLQPHSQTVNDLPIRLYGVIPLSVEDPSTRLEPVILMPDVLEPGQEVTITVSEKSKRKMTYTLAMVDEGLLDLTHFKTPDLWARFYAREALGVKTWDLYDQVIGSFGGRVERLLAVGGDGELMAKEDDAKANRFRPVVIFHGPVTLDGASRQHTFTMPSYIGSVKTMIVAGYEGAYGSAEKATPVRKPLMVLATLPRVLGPGENLKLPVTLFTQESSIRNVKVDVKVTGPVALPGSASQTVTMNNPDQTFEFDLSVKNETGVAKVEVTAVSGKFTASDVIEINVRNPNPPVTRVTDAILENGRTWTSEVTPVGLSGSNSATLEVSSLPAISLAHRMKSLLQYPYGCLEQTISSVFPQLYLDQVKELVEGEKQVIQRNVKAGIEKLKTFGANDGGFVYWPGTGDSESWSSTYAGHFLLEAESKGYFVPNEMIRRWKRYQKNKVSGWRRHQEQFSSELIQAYRLYTLALAGEAELSAMNRLRELAPLPAAAAWMLAAAYTKAGQSDAARSLVAQAPMAINHYQEMAYSYGSDLRDKAIILETLVMIDERAKGLELLKDIAAALSNPNSWMSTQTTAWCLKSVGAFAAKQQKGELRFTYTFGAKEVTASTGLPFAQVVLPIEGTKAGSLKVASGSKGTLFIRLITQGTPARGAEEEEANNLSINVGYMDMDGNPVDPVRLEQGQQFRASVSVGNSGLRGAYRNLAIQQIFPSGWEISNLRFEEVESRLQGDQPTYQDIRDDRVYTYFDLGPGQRKTFRVLLTATYTGSYYLPAVSCEAMYDRGVYARTRGQEVSVIKRMIP